MHVIVHKIRLKDIAQRAAFRDWVETTDYAACKQLSAIEAFEVIEISRSANAHCHFIEIIHLNSLQHFEQQMQTPLFHSLVHRFNQLADIVDEMTGERVADGYQQ